ncbi:hypothetical protein VNO77_34028 [Canavalia gladiata]|uniref:Uncharacterized protein n=1 Tax=Canavalia gladiata TaxID=3824 RepID=A0AAN9KFV0_CANGL
MRENVFPTRLNAYLKFGINAVVLLFDAQRQETATEGMPPNHSHFFVSSSCANSDVERLGHWSHAQVGITWSSSRASSRIVSALLSLPLPRPDHDSTWHFAGYAWLTLIPSYIMTLDWWYFMCKLAWIDVSYCSNPYQKPAKVGTYGLYRLARLERYSSLPFLLWRQLVSRKKPLQTFVFNFMLQIRNRFRNLSLPPGF